jgi:hypothetical protein
LAGQGGQAEKNKGLRLEQGTLKNDLERFFVERNAVAGAIPPTELAFTINYASSAVVLPWQ